MNKLIIKLYDQAIILEGNGDYVTGELDPVKFAELIVRECAYIMDKDADHPFVSRGSILKQHFGVEE